MTGLFSRLGRLAAVASGRSVFESALYRESELTRLANLFAHVDLSRWDGYRVLEVGAGPGRFGDAFVELGFDVTSTDGRPEHVERMEARGRKALVLDLDTQDVGEAGDFDLILAFGVLYHLGEPERFLRGCGRAARVLLLESCVGDALEPVAPRVREKRGADQALHTVGCRPSPSWVESTCREAGFDVVRDISNPLGDWTTGRFDWEPRGDGAWRRDGKNLRKMWVIERS